MPRHQRAEVVSVHRTRRAAQSKERELTAAKAEYNATGYGGAPERAWVKGYRVRKAGFLQYVVEATDWKGH